MTESRLMMGWRAIAPGTLFRVVSVLVLLSGCGPYALPADAAKNYYKEGQAAELHEDLDAAYRDYRLAWTANPGEIRYKMAMERLRASAAARHVRRGESLASENQTKDALVEFFRAVELDPGNVLAQQDIGKLKEEMDKKDRLGSSAELPDADDLEKPAPPVHLDPVPAEVITLHMTEQSGVVYRAIGRAAGLNVLFDPDFVSKTITVDLKQITLIEALRILGDLSNTFWKASTHDTIYVAPNTRAKRTELQQLAVRTFYL